MQNKHKLIYNKINYSSSLFYSKRMWFTIVRPFNCTIDFEFS